MNFFPFPSSSLEKPAAVRQRGAVLVVVLWVIIALSLLALSFSAAIRTEVNAARNVIDQKECYYAARAGIEYAIFRILEAQQIFSTPQSGETLGPLFPEVLTGSVSLELGRSRAEVEIIDETGKINLNLAPAHMIFNLLITVGVDPRQADVITDSIEDWRDPDDFYRPNGAESDYYESLEEPYLAKNAPFDLPEELLLVRGVTPEIFYGRKGTTDSGEPVEYYGLQKYFTTFSSMNRINVNSAPLLVLASLPGLDYDTALEIDALRKAAPISDASEIARRIPGLPTDTLTYLSTLRTNVYTLNSLGRVEGSEVVSRIRSVIRVDGTGRKGYAVLYWNESNVEL